MNKIFIVCGLALTLSSGASFGSTDAMTLDDAAGYSPVPFIIDDEVNMTTDSAEDEWAAVEDEEAVMTPLATPVCGISPTGAPGWCVFNGDEILCTVPEGSALNTAVGIKYEVPDRVHVCSYVAGAWVETGWCDIGTRVKLRVLGMNNSRDSIGVIRHVWGEGAGGAILPGADCNFNEFKDVFEPLGVGDPAYLKIYGRGQYDWIYGSQFDDFYLSGEYVDGRESDDKIYMTNNEIGTFASYTSAFGDYGADRITGSASPDDIWADNPSIATKAEGGKDWANGAGGDDYVRGAWFNDELYGGAGADSIYGGDELGVDGTSDDGDLLYGDGGRDTIWGMDGRDRLRGGTGNDALYGHDNTTVDDDGLYDLCWGDGDTDVCVCDWEDVSCES